MRVMLSASRCGHRCVRCRAFGDWARTILSDAGSEDLCSQSGTLPIGTYRYINSGPWSGTFAAHHVESASPEMVFVYPHAFDL